jgi:electron transfer flavoprotein alpha/beta subunit
MAAKKKEIRVVTPAAVEAMVEVVSLSVPVRSKKTQLIEGAPAAAAAELVKRLRDEARAL